MVNTESLEQRQINPIVVTDRKRCSKFGLVLSVGKIGWVRVITGEILSFAFIIGSLVILVQSLSIDQGASAELVAAGNRA